MSWKTEILERVRRKVKTIDRYDAKEEALAYGDKDRAKYLSLKGDKLEMWVYGVLDALETIGYVIKYNDDGSVENILGEFSTAYRVRYRNDRFTNAIICNDGNEVQTVIDRLKATSLRNPEYKFEGIDSRVIYPNGDTGEWNKIFDF